jgi:succinate dehydrogenase / fumarate reductase, membrane anchor subunit
MLINLLTERYPGMRFWLLQRMTAIFMSIYIPLFIVYFMISMPSGYQGWVDFNSPWWWRVLSWLFFFSLCIHAWIGVRDVLRDYVFNQTLRAYLQAMVELVLLACLVWSIVIIWSI